MRPGMTLRESPRTPVAAEEVAAAAGLACLLEASVPKPGNVHPGARFDDVAYEDFVLSALAIGPAFARADAGSVGLVVLRAVRDTGRVAAGNTNLGLILLLAPLAVAAATRGLPLQPAVTAVLDDLDADDTGLVYEAIRRAGAGGLGKAPRHDLAEAAPNLPLRQVMATAAERDAIAREYATGYRITFEVAVPALRAAWPDPMPPPQGTTGEAMLPEPLERAVCDGFLHILAAVPDTLIARKRGFGRAEAVSREAEEILGAGGCSTAAGREALRRLDRALRSEGNALNPGTTADLLGAALFVLLVEEREAGADSAGEGW